MKTKLLLPFLTALVLTGCSNDDAPDNNGGGNANGETSYLAVNIVTPKDVIGRDITSNTGGDFEYGTSAENAAESATFILLDNNTVFQISTETLSSESTNSPDATKPHNNVEKVFNAVIVIPGSKTKLNVTGILAILNAPADLSENIKVGKTLDEIKTVLGNYSTDGTSGSFIMTNSVHIDDSKTIIATPVSELYSDKQIAMTHPVQIYVERIVAKIKTNKVDDITTAGSDKFNHGAEVELEKGSGKLELNINIKGIQIANCAKQSYLFKNIDGLTATGTTAPWNNWNDAANHRSYWAAKIPTSNPVAPSDFINKSWNEISGVGDKNTAQSLLNDNTFYVQENINQTYKTSVIVTAQLTKKSDDTAIDFVRIAGLYYTKEDGLIHIAELLESRGYRVKDNSGNIKKFSKDYIEWIKTPTTVSGAKAWNASAQIKNAYKTGYTFYIDGTPTKELTVDQINETLNESQYRALLWENGMCYYFAEIEHFGTEEITITTGEGDAKTTTTETVNRKGVIRNHLYNITLNSIGGLGVPVVDPDDPIIPDRPDDDESLFYLAAKVNILSWKVVSQGVDLK